MCSCSETLVNMSTISGSKPQELQSETEPKLHPFKHRRARGIRILGIINLGYPRVDVRTLYGLFGLSGLSSTEEEKQEEEEESINPAA